jgi:hypothetical protein
VPPAGSPDGGVGLDPPSLSLPSLGIGAEPGIWLQTEGARTGGEPPHVSSQPVVNSAIPHASFCRISLAHVWQPHVPRVDMAAHISSLISPQVGVGRVALLNTASKASVTHDRHGPTASGLVWLLSHSSRALDSAAQSCTSGVGPTSAVALLGDGAGVEDVLDGHVPKQSDPQMHFSSFSMEGPQVPQALVHVLVGTGRE